MTFEVIHCLVWGKLMGVCDSVLTFYTSCHYSVNLKNQQITDENLCLLGLFLYKSLYSLFG